MDRLITEQDVGRYDQTSKMQRDIIDLIQRIECIVSEWNSGGDLADAVNDAREAAREIKAEYPNLGY